MAFIKFSNVGKKQSLYISFTPSKSFGIGGDFLKDNNLLDCNYATLFWDKDALQIGFKFTKEKDKNEKSSFTMATNKNTDSRTIIARSFFREYLKGFNMNDYKSKYEPEEINDEKFGKMFIVQLIRKDFDKEVPF